MNDDAGRQFVLATPHILNTRTHLPGPGDWRDLTAREIAVLRDLVSPSSSLTPAIDEQLRESALLRRTLISLALRAGLDGPREVVEAVAEFTKAWGSSQAHSPVLEDVVMALQRAAPARAGAYGTFKRPAPQAVQDDEHGADLKPDPYSAATMGAFRQALRAYWEWVGQPSAARVADACGGAFKKSTAAKLINADPSVPLKLEQVTGMIRGCGGDDAELSRWASAFRRLKRTGKTRHLTAVSQ